MLPKIPRKRRCIPLPINPAKSIPKARPRAEPPKRSTSFQSKSPVVDRDDIALIPSAAATMNHDYTKAVTYVNSCHKFVNAIIRKEASNPIFLLPSIPNYQPLFEILMGNNSTRSINSNNQLEILSDRSEGSPRVQNSINHEFIEMDNKDVGPSGETICQKKIEYQSSHLSDSDLEPTQITPVRVKSKIQRQYPDPDLSSLDTLFSSSDFGSD